MSVIFNPADVALSPSYIDGFENILTKSGRVQTQSTSFVTLRSVVLAAGLFNISNVRFKLEFIGRTLGAAGNKNIRIQFDGNTVYDSSAIALSNAIFEGYTILTFDGTNLVACTCFRGTSSAGLGGAVGQHQEGGTVAIAIDASASHTLTFQALVINAADTLIVDWIGASVR